jgi:hypothetical protein
MEMAMKLIDRIGYFETSEFFRLPNPTIDTLAYEKTMMEIHEEFNYEQSV